MQVLENVSAILLQIEYAEFRPIDLARRSVNENRNGAAARAHISTRMRFACLEVAKLDRITFLHAALEYAYKTAVKRAIANVDDHRAPTPCSRTRIILR